MKPVFQQEYNKIIRNQDNNARYTAVKITTAAYRNQRNRRQEQNKRQQIHIKDRPKPLRRRHRKLNDLADSIRRRLRGLNGKYFLFGLSSRTIPPNGAPATRRAAVNLDPNSLFKNRRHNGRMCNYFHLTVLRTNPPPLLKNASQKPCRLK